MTKEPMAYRQALPYLLKRKGWSYRELDWRTRKSASYWNQTVNGRQGPPKNAKSPRRSKLNKLMRAPMRSRCKIYVIISVFGLRSSSFVILRQIDL